MKRRDFLKSSLATALGLGAGLPFLKAGALDSKPPNIILIMADDLGWGDLGCYGNPWVKTPVIDQLARNGLRFKQFYVNSSLCSPSRTAFLTGRFPSELSVFNVYGHEEADDQQGMADFLSPDLPMLSKGLRQLGYHTAHVGKWHIDMAPKSKPVDYGFDIFREWHHLIWEKLSDKEQKWTRSSELIVDTAISSLDKLKQPFFLNIWLFHPHAVLNPTDEQIKPFADLHPHPDVNFHGAREIYYAALLEMDTEIGRLMEYLDDKKLRQNTLTLFTSDNGPETVYVNAASASAAGSTGPFRGRKRSLYEGGIRVPFIASWPGKIPDGLINTNTVLSGIDLFPSLEKLAGGPGNNPLEVDGEDLCGVLLGKTQVRKGSLYWEQRFPMKGDLIDFSPPLAIRSDQWKLLCDYDGSDVELYDMTSGFQETDNVAVENPECAARLKSELLAWAKSLPEGPKPVKGQYRTWTLPQYK